MHSSVVPVLVGLAAGIGLIAMFSVWSSSLESRQNQEQPADSSVTLNASDFIKSRGGQFLTDGVIAKSVHAASQHEQTGMFLNKFMNITKLDYAIAYLDSNQVLRTKYSPGGTQYEEFAFLPDSKPAILVELSVVTPIVENPRLWVFVQPGTYRLLGAHNAFWDDYDFSAPAWVEHEIFCIGGKCDIDWLTSSNNASSQLQSVWIGNNFGSSDVPLQYIREYHQNQGIAILDIKYVSIGDIPLCEWGECGGTHLLEVSVRTSDLNNMIDSNYWFSFVQNQPG
jgi:hypothetical protein